jgi:hypothetical protein
MFANPLKKVVPATHISSALASSTILSPELLPFLF